MCQSGLAGAGRAAQQHNPHSGPLVDLCRVEKKKKASVDGHEEENRKEESETYSNTTRNTQKANQIMES